MLLTALASIGTLVAVLVTAVVGKAECQDSKAAAPVDDREERCKQALRAAIALLMNGDPACRAGFHFDSQSIADEFDAMLAAIAANERLDEAVDSATDEKARKESAASKAATKAKLLDDISNGKTEIQGQSAVITSGVEDPESPTGRSTLQRRLVQADGVWLVDAAQALNIRGDPDRIRGRRELESAINEVTQDIQAGRAKPPFSTAALVRSKILAKRGGQVPDSKAVAPAHSQPEAAKPSEGERYRWTTKGKPISLALAPKQSLVFVGVKPPSGCIVLLDRNQADPVRSFSAGDAQILPVAVATTSDGAMVAGAGAAFERAQAAEAEAQGGDAFAYSRVTALDYDVRVWNSASGGLVHRLKGHTGFVQSLAISRDGRWIAAGGMATVIVWDLRTGERVRAIEMSNKPFGGVRGLEFSPDGKSLAVGVQWDTGSVLVYSTDDWTRRWAADLDRCVGPLTFSPDGATIAVSRIGAAVLYSREGLVRGAMPCIADGAAALVNAVAFSPDGRFLMCAEGIERGGDGGGLGAALLSTRSVIRAFDVDQQRQLALLHGHRDSVRVVQMWPNGGPILSCSLDGTVREWDIPQVMKAAKEVP
jgi:hypothetical protein